MPIATPDAKIFFHDAPYIQYEQFRLNLSRNNHDLEKSSKNKIHYCKNLTKSQSVHKILRSNLPPPIDSLIG